MVAGSIVELLADANLASPTITLPCRNQIVPALEAIIQTIGLLHYLLLALIGMRSTCPSFYHHETKLSLMHIG